MSRAATGKTLDPGLWHACLPALADKSLWLLDCFGVQALARLLHPGCVRHQQQREVAMDADIDAKQTERILSHLARLKHHGDQKQMEALESLRPTWLGMDAWNVVLEDLEAQCYRERARVVRLQLVGR